MAKASRIFKSLFARARGRSPPPGLRKHVLLIPRHLHSLSAIGFRGLSKILLLPARDLPSNETAINRSHTSYIVADDGIVCVCVCVRLLGSGEDVSGDGGFTTVVEDARISVVQIIPPPSATPPPRAEDAGLRGTGTDCSRQNFLNYPAASRNNSGDSNIVVYVEPVQHLRDKQTRHKTGRERRNGWGGRDREGGGWSGASGERDRFTR